jgi:hypothetical protein
MSTVTLTLPDDKLAVLADMARQEGTTVESFLERVVVERALQSSVVPDDVFRRAMDDSFREHAELYRRLAK